MTKMKRSLKYRISHQGPGSAKNISENSTLINSRMTFKQFLYEEEVKVVASRKAMELLGRAHQASGEEEEKLKDLLDVAKQEKVEKINSPVGPWILSLFKTAAKTFVTAYPPKSYGKDPIFFVKD